MLSVTAASDLSLQSYERLAHFQLRSGSYAQALATTQKSLKLLQAIPVRKCAATISGSTDLSSIPLGVLQEAPVCTAAKDKVLARTLLVAGNVAFLHGDPAAAHRYYEQSLQTDANLVDAAYALGALQVFLGMPHGVDTTLTYLDRVAQHPRFSADVQYLRQTIDPKTKDVVVVPVPPPVGSEHSTTQSALAHPIGDQTTADNGSAHQELLANAERLLAREQYAQALQLYKKLMPMAASNPRFQVGMGWALHHLQHPMRERVWRVAMGHPDALSALARRLNELGAADAASRLKRLLHQSTVPAQPSNVPQP